MQKEYEQSDKLHIVMMVKVFEEKASDTPYYQEKVDIKKDKLSYHYRFGATEMLMNHKYLIMVDRNATEIVYSKRDQKAEVSMKSLVQFGLDSILGLYEIPAYLGTQHGVSHYRIIQKAGPVDQIDLFINTQTNLLKKMEYQYREGHFVSILFEAFNKQPKFSEATFDERQYVRGENGRFKGAGDFNQYTISEGGIR